MLVELGVILIMILNKDTIPELTLKIINWINKGN